jgi:hypothetical protein
MSVHNEGIIISGSGSVSADKLAVGRNAQVNQTNYSTGNKYPDLAEAAAEIQRLLQQLKKTNPTATEHEQVAYINVATNPSIKQRTVEALKAGGESAMDEFVLENKYLKVGKAIIKGWLQPEI